MTQLLVSVRSVAEARDALAGGADLIDVKDPARGPLGRADEDVMVAVLREVAGRRPVSVALGELLEHSKTIPANGFAYAKWGLAGCGANPNWPKRFGDVRRTLPLGCTAVAVAYADWQAAAAPFPEEVCAFACDHGLPLLVDTWAKTGKRLLDWLPCEQIINLCHRCRQAGVPIALAGSIDLAQIEMLRPAAPNWFAVRGSACRMGQRRDGVDAERVRLLAASLSGKAAVQRTA